MARRAEAIWMTEEKRWKIRVSKDGQRKAFYSSDPSIKGKREVEKKATAWLASGDSGDIRFGQLWEQYLKRCKETTGTANYKQHELMGRQWLLPILQHKKMTKITPLMWQTCIDEGYKHGLAKASLKNIRASIVQAHKFAKMLRVPVEMPELIIPRGAPAGERKILQPDQLKILFNTGSYEKNNRTYEVFYIYAFRFAVLTGIRRGELCGLKNDDLKKDRLSIKRAINNFREETTGKNDNARREFVLFEFAQEVLEQQRAMLKRKRIISPWVFPNTQGNRSNPRTFYNNWKRYREMVGIECSLHELRHTAISVAGPVVPEVLLKELVGHSAAMDTFGVYGHEIDGNKQHTADLMQNAFARFLKDE